MKSLTLAIEAHAKLGEFIAANGGDTLRAVESLEVSPAGVILPDFVKELSAKIKAKYPKGTMDSGGFTIPVDFCHNGIIWKEGVEGRDDLTAEQRNSIAGNFHAPPNFGIFMLGRGPLLAYSPHASHIEKVEVGKRKLPSGAEIASYVWNSKEPLPEVWTIRPDTYHTPAELEEAMRALTRYHFGVD